MRKIRVFFNIKPHYRTRQRETTRHLPENVEAILPEEKGMADHKIKEVYSQGPMKITLELLKKLPYINMKFVNDSNAKTADIIYSYGAVLLTGRKYILELDTPYILTLYNTHTMHNRIMRAIIKKFLKAKNLRQIVCISEACKNSLHNLFHDPEIDKKSTVIYPYVSEKKFSPRKGKTILHIAYNYYLKGGRELLGAFLKISKKHRDAKLIMVCNVPEEVKKKYARNRKIRFVEPKMPKQELYDKYYSKASVFVAPTHYDSFNMTVLEALSCGLPVIATRMFAIPEMVEHGRNGYVLDRAVDYYDNEFLAVDKFWNIDLADYLKEKKYPNLTRELARHLDKILREDINSMGKKSYMLARTKFAVAKRNEMLREIFGEAVR